MRVGRSQSASGLNWLDFPCHWMAPPGSMTPCLGNSAKVNCRRRAGCQIAVEFRDPDNHRLEIYWGLDLVGAPGTARPAAEWRGAKSLEEAVDNPVPGQDTTLFDPTLRRG